MSVPELLERARVNGLTVSFRDGGIEVSASLALGFMAAPALAQPIEYDKKTCICSEGSGACQKFLRAPKKVTDDPCWCHRCRLHSEHDGGQIPFGWNALCFNSKKEPNYLRRHSAAWGITCSDCFKKNNCRFNKQNCPNCGEHETTGPLVNDYRGRDAEKTVMAQLQKESRHHFFSYRI